MSNNVGVFTYKSPVLKYRPVDEQEAISWSGVMLAVAITLLIVVGASSIFSNLQAKIEGRPSAGIHGILRNLAMVNIAEAATVSNTLDRSDYYSKNANLYKPAPVVKKPVATAKTTVKATTSVKKPVVTTTKAKTVTSNTTIKKPAAVVATVKAQPVVKNTVQLTATRMIQTAPAVTIGANDRMAFEIGFKNTSNEIWSANSGIKLHSTSKGESYFYDNTWDAKNIAVTLKNDIKPGEIGYFKFTLGAPVKTGSYNESLYLAKNGTKIIGGELTLPIQVVTKPKTTTTLASAKTVDPNSGSIKQFKEATASDSQSTTNTVGSPTVNTTQQTQNVSVTPAQSGVITDIQTTEQLIRVGLFAATTPTQITANKDYSIKDGEGKIISTEKAGAITTVVFDTATKQYTVTTPTATTMVTTYVRFTGTSNILPDNDTIFEIPSYTNRPGWSSALNDNKFRAVLEVRYASKTNKVWVINELYLEQYLRGLAETSNSSPYEYQKALITAARTYAQYHIVNSTKYLGENFTVRNTDADQVYRGYGSESRMPNLARAVAETRGVIVTYQGKLAITPYYSQSDGRTRTWTEVWGGSAKPWLVSVPDPACEGLEMWGHGVGMSARGALSMAADGKKYEEILKYYYTGIDLKKIFN